jgi:hypothetical protein
MWPGRSVTERRLAPGSGNRARDFFAGLYLRFRHLLRGCGWQNDTPPPSLAPRELARLVGTLLSRNHRPLLREIVRELLKDPELARLLTDTVRTREENIR